MNNPFEQLMNVSDHPMPGFITSKLKWQGSNAKLAAWKRKTLS
ncbi:MAG: hypothetical protein P4M14_10120 [Gammaproteobacteria bacterium]|nr:hypothetical protein [Gammaproteobacteria bacterium]